MSKQFYPYTPAISSGLAISAIADNLNTTTLTTRLLDRLIAFHHCFVDLTGSITAALLLSQAFDWQHGCEDLAGWWCKTQKAWTEATGLNRWELGLTHKKLRQLGMFGEKLSGMPARLRYRVNWVALRDAITGVTQRLPDSSL